MQISRPELKDIAVHGSEGQQAPKIKTKHYDDVDLAQMSLFDTVKDDDIIQELKDLGRQQYDSDRCAKYIIPVTE